MKITKTIIITGAHHTPAIELIKQLNSDRNFNWQIHYIGNISQNDTHLKHIIIPRLKENFHHISCGKYHRNSLLLTLFSIPKIFLGFIQSIILFNKIKPDITVSFGSYVSVPVIIASYMFSIPSITHEQTITISLATRINSFFANKVALTFEESNVNHILPPSKIAITGNLVRSEIFNHTSTIFSHLISEIRKKQLIYITGGSRGSEFINNIILESLPLLSKYTIIHQTGPKGFQQINNTNIAKKYPNYHPVDYVDDQNIGWVLNNASLIIGRAGANNCLDLYTLNKKAILIPIPFAQQNEQLLNAQWLKSKLSEKIIILNQNQITPKILISSITSLIELSVKSNSVIKTQPNLLLKLIHETI